MEVLFKLRVNLNKTAKLARYPWKENHTILVSEGTRRSKQCRTVHLTLTGQYKKCVQFDFNLTSVYGEIHILKYNNSDLERVVHAYLIGYSK